MWTIQLLICNVHYFQPYSDQREKAKLTTLLFLLDLSCLFPFQRLFKVKHIVALCVCSCFGGFPSAAWEFWTKSGLVTGGLYDSKVGKVIQLYSPCF